MDRHTKPSVTQHVSELFVKQCARESLQQSACLRTKPNRKFAKVECSQLCSSRQSKAIPKIFDIRTATTAGVHGQHVKAHNCEPWYRTWQNDALCVVPHFDTKCIFTWTMNGDQCVGWL